MKNIFKKITAAVMAFTLLGAGSVIKTSTDNKCDCHNHTLTAEAYYTSHCGGTWQNHNFQIYQRIGRHTWLVKCTNYLKCNASYVKITDCNFYFDHTEKEVNGSYYTEYNIYYCGECGIKKKVVSRSYHI